MANVALKGLEESFWTETYGDQQLNSARRNHLCRDDERDEREADRRRLQTDRQLRCESCTWHRSQHRSQAFS